MDPYFKAVSDYGITVVVAVVLGATVAFFIRDLIRQRDSWRSMAENAVAAVERMADQLDMQPMVGPGRKTPGDRS